MEKQPAHKSYVFEQAYGDVGRAFASFWGRTFDPVSNELDRLRDIFYSGGFLAGLFTLIIDLPVFTVITLFNIVLNMVFSLFLIVLFMLAAPVVYVGFVLVCIADWIFRIIKRISSRCSLCQNKFPLPVYICPNCGRIHTKLIPSQYGIFKRRCLCGRKIPTTFFNGRQKLEAQCPKCGFDIRDGGNHRDICITVVGGPNAGKTCYINMAISQLERTAPVKNNLVFDYACSRINNYKPTIDAMRRRQLPDKTGDLRLQYYQFYLTPKGEKLKRLVSLCDVAGELYADGGRMSSQVGYRHSDAFLVIVDPLSIVAYKNQLAKTYNLSSFRGSSMPIDEIMSRLISTLENMRSKTSKSVLATDVAVVFTKCDIPGLDAEIGKTAVARCMKTGNLSQLEASNLVCEDFLNRYGEGNFVRGLKSKFKSVQFFTCSALGSGPRGAEFVPEGVEAPVLWVYHKVVGKWKGNPA